ncbi:hypothetical protein D3C86_1047770 [compost metagenome]
MFDQPDEVGGELALLRLCQCRAELDAVVHRELGAVGEQLLVLAVVVAEAFQEALAGGGQDLVGDQFLFIETVAQATGLAGRGEEFCAGGDQGVQAAGTAAQAGVDGSGGAAVADGRARLLQQVEQVVAGYGGAVADEARVGGDHVRRVGPAVDGEELAVRDGGRVGYAAHDAAAGQADAGDQDRAGRGGAAGPRRAAAERDRNVAAGGADGQFDGFRGQGLLVVAGVFLAVSAAWLRHCGRAHPRDSALAAGPDVIDGRTAYRQRSAGGNLALVVGDGADQRHRAARHDLARVGRKGAGFGDGFLDLVDRNGVHHPILEVCIERTDARIQFLETRQVGVIGLFVGLTASILSRIASPVIRAAYWPLLQLRLRPRRRRHPEDRPNPRIRAIAVHLRRNRHIVSGPCFRRADLAILLIRTDCSSGHIYAGDRPFIARNTRVPRRIVKWRTIAFGGIRLRRQQESVLRVILQNVAVFAPGTILHAEPIGLNVVHVRRARRGHVQLGDRQHRQRLADEVGVDVLQRRGRDRRVSGRLDGGRCVQQRPCLADGLAVCVQRAADAQVGACVDQRVVAVHQRSDAQVQVAARSDDGAAARARAVDELPRAN